MKKITYKERAKFYTNEVKKDSKQLNLLKKFKKKYNINTMILCPCASGVYLNDCSEIFKQSYFVDIEKTMIDIIKKNKVESGIKNVETCICNMKNINSLKIKCDCIFALDQGIQYLNHFEFKLFLKNSYLISKYIILELFDFNLGKKLSYYNSKFNDNELYFSKSFIVNGVNFKRYNKHIHHKKYIDFYYQYFNENSYIFETNFRLYNYDYNTVEKIIDESGKYIILEKLENCNGAYVLLLSKKNERNISK